MLYAVQCLKTCRLAPWISLRWMLHLGTHNPAAIAQYELLQHQLPQRPRDVARRRRAQRNAHPRGRRLAPRRPAHDGRRDALRQACDLRRAGQGWRRRGAGRARAVRAQRGARRRDERLERVRCRARAARRLAPSCVERGKRLGGVLQARDQRPPVDGRVQLGPPDKWARVVRGFVRRARSAGAAGRRKGCADGRERARVGRRIRRCADVRASRGAWLRGTLGVLWLLLHVAGLPVVARHRGMV